MPLPILDPDAAGASSSAARAGVCALAVMAKAPRPGKVKTRLSPPLTSQQAAALNICFLRDTTESIAAVAGAVGLISYTPVGDEGLFEGLLPAGFALIPQRGEAFGERLLAAAQDILACGFASVCLIDSDSPTVPHEALEQAVAELARPGDRVVIGPSADGGYYLIGMKQPHAAAFERITWSTEKVYAETCERVYEVGIELVELPLWYDVDDGPTLDLLRAELLLGLAPGFATVAGYEAKHTRAMLLELDTAHTAEKRLAQQAGGAADAAVDEQERPG